MRPNITKLRLDHQQITNHDFKTPKELVKWMGALQAQDYGMAKWAVGLRVPGTTDHQVQQAIDKGDIVRTHVLRPTWHLVHVDDIRWMLTLTAPEILKIAGSYSKRLGLDKKLLSKTNRILERSLQKADHLTRSELIAPIEKAGIKLDNLQASHVLVQAELDMVICNGERRGKQLTYALFDKRVPLQKTLDREAALTKLADIYFSSHGPATLQDFEWWSGLLIRDARMGLENMKDQFQSFTIDRNTYWFRERKTVARKSDLFLLPAFDEYLISYADRSAAIDPTLAKTAMTVNGIFHPTIVINGKIEGTWKRFEKGKKLIIAPQLKRSLTELQQKKMLKVATAYATFLGMREGVSVT